MTNAAATKSAPLWLNILLWLAQGLLFLFFGSAGYMKLATPPEQLAEAMTWAAASPSWLITFIGLVEVLGAVGVILPAFTRILPFLTPLAAVGFAIIQVLAIGVHASLGETAMTLPINLVALAVSAFVAWGRFIAAPISPRSF